MNIINDQSPEMLSAIASQEEHIKRSRSCLGQIGLPHSFRRCGKYATKQPFNACVTCGVTETARDYAIRNRSTS